MSVLSQEESELLDRIAVDLALETLAPVDAALIQMRFAYRMPEDYAGPWPPRRREIGVYVGRRFLGRPISATRTQERMQRVLDRWCRVYEHEGGATQRPDAGATRPSRLATDAIGAAERKVA